MQLMENVGQGKSGCVRLSGLKLAQSLALLMTSATCRCTNPKFREYRELEGTHMNHQSPTPGPALGQPQESHTQTRSHGMD